MLNALESVVQRLLTKLTYGCRSCKGDGKGACMRGTQHTAPSRSGLFVCVLPLNPPFDIVILQHVASFDKLEPCNTFHDDVYCLAVSLQATLDLRSITCRIMSSNRRVMWDRSPPASPLHSPSVLDSRSTSTLQRGPLLKVQESQVGVGLACSRGLNQRLPVLDRCRETTSFLTG